MDESTQILLRGLSISHGIAIGFSLFFNHYEDVIPERSISEAEIEKEVERYQKAISHCKQDLKRLQRQMDLEGALEASSILETHLQIMQDPLLINIEKEIAKQKKNAEFIFHTFVQGYLKKFEAITDPFFRERSRDLKDIARRIMGNLKEGKGSSFADIPPNTIVFTSELAPSDAAETKIDFQGAFVCTQGAITSHAAIVAKAKGIPYVANIDFSTVDLSIPTLTIVDGRAGEVIINPTPEVLEKYQALQSQLTAHFQKLESTASCDPITYDGYRMRLSANIELVGELENLHLYGADGVGLFRSEYIFLTKQYFPDEEEQFGIYKRVVEKMRGLPIVIRTFDVGGDKIVLNDLIPQELNPYMGCRAIRFLLKEKQIFKTQLKAILRACNYGNVSIMFPMVSGLPELLAAKEMIEEAKQELEERGVIIQHSPKIGCMIEVPSAAIIADLLAKECDFLSIGTNDLVQYSLAVDRTNQAMSMLYTPTHPSIMRLIQLVVCQAKKYGVPVGVCGEVAADPRFTALLIGLGIQELSVSSRYLPVIKDAIRNTSIVEAIALAEKVLSLETSSQIEEVLNQAYQDKGADLSVFQHFFFQEIIT